MADPIGVSFIPSQDNQQPGGPPQGQMQGDLAQAFKILSLRLPSVVGAGGIAPNTLLQSQGALGVPGATGGPTGFNPYAALFEALLKHGLGQPGGQPVSSTMPIPGGGPMPMPAGPTSNYNPPAPPQPMPQAPPPMGVPAPRVIPGSVGDVGNTPAPNPSPTFGSWMSNERKLGGFGY